MDRAQREQQPSVRVQTTLQPVYRTEAAAGRWDQAFITRGFQAAPAEPRHLPLGSPHLLCTSVAAWRLDVSAGSTSR